MNDTITWPFDFLAHNRKVREQVEAILTRTRDSGYLNLDEAAYRFYAARLGPRADRSWDEGRGRGTEAGGRTAEGGGQGISAVAELVDLMRERRGAEPRFLMMEMDDLRDPTAPEQDTTAFPGELPLENRALPLAYAYKPGQADDGVTLEVSVGEAEVLTPAALDWAVPGHLEAKVEHYLRTLPKELRRAFVPLAETAPACRGAGRAAGPADGAARGPDGGAGGAVARRISDRGGPGTLGGQAATRPLARARTGGG